MLTMSSSARARTPTSPAPGTSLGHPGGQPEHGGVPLQQVVEAGPLDLDHHRLTGTQHGPVDLADGGGGQGLRLERGEHLAHRPAQLDFD
jgi:hypothetical protein